MLEKYISAKHSVQSTASELNKLEKNHKSELRMISTAAFKIRSKFNKVEDPRRWQSEIEACNVRMYETHFPGFCYLKDGKYRRKVVNIKMKTADPVESTKKLKSLLFTDDEIDIQKVMCLHLLGTHVHNRKLIYRKDGRLCSYVKLPTQGNKKFTLQAASQRTCIYEKEIPHVYDMMPRYILDIKFLDRIFSNLSLHTCDVESFSDDEHGKRRKFQVPIYINNDIRIIVGSVIEALEAVNSPKLKDLLALARSPEELKNLLAQEDILEFIIDLAGDQLVTRATAYDFILTQPVLDKNPDDGTKETVAQVLELINDSGLRNMLHLIRKTISRRHDDLVQCNVLPGKKKGQQSGKGSVVWNGSKTSFFSGETSTKTCSSAHGYCPIEITSESKYDRNAHPSQLKGGICSKMGSQSLRSIFQNRMPREQSKILSTFDENIHAEDYSISFAASESTGSRSQQQFGRFQNSEMIKNELRSLNNSQRILLGLKVASMKNRPVNMHHLENKKKIDMGALIASIVQTTDPDVNKSEPFFEDNIYNRGLKRAKRLINKPEGSNVQDLPNLTRGDLSNFRHEISTTENKKRVVKFLNSKF